MANVLVFIKTRWIAITIILLVAITVVSLLPLAALPPAPGGDKIHHTIAYALLTIPAALRKPRKWTVLCLFFIAYSGLIELLQPFVNRYCDWIDLMANASGVAAGVIVAHAVNRWSPR
jgi:hypothetical protein